MTPDEMTIAAIRADMLKAFNSEPTYITPERCKEVILGVLMHHVKLGTIEPSPPVELKIMRDEKTGEVTGEFTPAFTVDLKA